MEKHGLVLVTINIRTLDKFIRRLPDLYSTILEYVV